MTELWFIMTFNDKSQGLAVQDQLKLSVQTGQSHGAREGMEAEQVDISILHPNLSKQDNPTHGIGTYLN